MNKQRLINFYRVHLTRLDGRRIDTETGTLTYGHAYLQRNGKPFSPAVIERKFNKSHNSKGFKVERVEVATFDANK